MRLEGTSKMGFYPTPSSQTKKILERLQFAKTGFSRLFDPCAGEGVALQDIAKFAKSDSFQPVTYGVEIDGHRAEEAAKRLDHAVHCGYEVARVDKQSMQFFLLNPPYDEQGGQGGLSNRKELVFLRDLSKYVAPGGILVYIIPQYVLSKDLVLKLLGRYTQVGIYKFDEEDYKVYKQVVIFAKRRMTSTRVILTNEEKEMGKFLFSCGEKRDDPSDIPFLDEPDGRMWDVPSLEENTPILFRGYELDPEELRIDLQSSDSYRVVENMLTLGEVETKLSRPLLPFRRAHMATLISAGVLNGAVGIGENRHIVVGMTKKIVETTTTVQENGDLVKQYTDKYKTAVRLICANGTIYDLE